MNRCPTSLITREIKIKNTVRYYFIPTRIAKIKKKKNPSIEDLKQLESIYVGGGSMKWYNHFGKQLVSFS